MKQMTSFCVAILLLITILSGCAGDHTAAEVSNPISTDRSEMENGENSTTPSVQETPGQTGNVGQIPQELAEIPESYFSPANEQGTLNDLYYDTWESFSYEEKSHPLEKHAVVYLPAGYDEMVQYDVFYLMHGGWGNENQTLGTPGSPSGFKNVIDHMIESGEIKPLIIVCPTYNNTSPDDSASFSLALQLNENLHNELLNDLLPAVEGKYSTYAADTTPEGLMASRDHRGFGGFSMGSVATWRTFQSGLDYFRYFLPMSCGTGLTDPDIYAAAEKRQDFFVWVITGTEDFAYSYDTSRVENMRSLPGFTESDSEAEGNFAYRIKEGYTHGGVSSMEYTYNGLRFFFGKSQQEGANDEPFTVDTPISAVTSDPAFGDYGRLIFPVNSGYFSGDTLGNLRLTWYNYIDPDKTVEICNYMKDHAAAGDTIFYDIYSDEEKAADPAKENTGLFFFKGNPGEKFAVCNAGGGFAYVGAMHDSFPHALELSKMGYNAFALIYRPGWDTAMEDLARAISFIFEHAEELEVDTDCYSLWGGSAGARMAADVGSYGTAYFGGDDLPQAGTVVMQYTGHSDYQRTDPPTYVCVGTSDGIANWRTMQSRINAMDAAGIPTEFHAYEGLPHGFGLGTGTVAEGWLSDAVAFWEEQMN